MNTPRTLAVLMHAHWCDVEHLTPAAELTHAELWERAGRDFAAAPSYERAAEVVHDLDCEHAEVEGPRSLSRLSHLSAVKASPLVRSWWARVGHRDPMVAA